MKHVDALSRHPVMNITYDEITAKIKNAQSNDEYTTTIKQLVDSDKVNDFQIRNDILFKLVDGKELLVIPDSMQTEIIKRAHDKGHFAVAKNEQIITLDYYFPKLTSKVQNVLANCVHCILVNRKRGKQEGFLNPIPKGDTPLHTYHIDFLGPLPSTNKNYKHIFTVTDAFTKFTWIYPVKTNSTSDALRSLELQKAHLATRHV
ncbi:transposon Tf2-9 polyprotein [Trichonephila clavipes]|nr:transposon Tf2-9 polyprotein [Trichonephila clavipes]